MPLHGGDRHHPLVRILEMSASFLGLHLARALHQQTCDDLEAVGDTVLHFLQQDRLLANEFILLPGIGANECDIGHCHHKPDYSLDPIVKAVRVHQKVSRFLALPDEVDLISLDLDAP